eukprot:7422153-Pyramimonas_sp.AAC.1
MGETGAGRQSGRGGGLVGSDSWHFFATPLAALGSPGRAHLPRSPRARGQLERLPYGRGAPQRHAGSARCPPRTRCRYELCDVCCEP